MPTGNHGQGFLIILRCMATKDMSNFQELTLEVCYINTRFFLLDMNDKSFNFGEATIKTWLSKNRKACWSKLFMRQLHRCKSTYKSIQPELLLEKLFFEKLEYKFNFIPGSGYWLGTYKIDHLKDAF